MEYSGYATSYFVTPCVGVWIETILWGWAEHRRRSHTLRGCVDWNPPYLTRWADYLQSHPAWVCGLKPTLSYEVGRLFTVTPCVGVWIETFQEASKKISMTSHPAWVCGLKHYDWRCESIESVTPCVGVWIETIMPVNPWRLNCHTLRGCVDWNSACLQVLFSGRVTPCVGVWIETPVPDFPNFCLCHTLRGCVDWNRNVIEFTDINYSHTLRGCVDWNTRITGINCGKCRHTLRGCVDWNFIIGFMNVRHFGSHPAWVCGLKHILNTLQMYKKVTPCVGVWIETMTRWIRV